MKAVKTPGATVSSASIKPATTRLEQTILPGFRRPGSRQRGYTIVEVAVSSAILAVCLLGVLGGLFYAYNAASNVRYHDSARFVLKSLGDQFQVMPGQTSTGGFNPMWVVTTAPTGVGLSWEDYDGTSTTHVDGTTSGLPVHLGGSSGNPISAVVMRDVRYLDASGNAVTTIASSSAGFLLRGDFTISYTYGGKPQSQTLSLVRAWP